MSTTITVNADDDKNFNPADGKPAEFTSFGQVRLNRNDNFQPRAPAAFIFDISGSMAGPPIAELNAAIPGLFQDLLRDDCTAARLEPCLIACGGDTADIISPFGPLHQLQSFRPNFEAGGKTPLGSSIELAMQQISHRREFYHTESLPYFLPTVIILSDGHPTDYAWEHASEELAKLAKLGPKNWTVIAIAIGPNADIEALRKVTHPDLPPLQLHGLKFPELFRWLSTSITIGASRPIGSSTGQTAPIDPPPTDVAESM